MAKRNTSKRTRNHRVRKHGGNIGYLVNQGIPNNQDIQNNQYDEDDEELVKLINQYFENDKDIESQVPENGATVLSGLIKLYKKSKDDILKQKIEKLAPVYKYKLGNEYDNSVGILYDNFKNDMKTAQKERLNKVSNSSSLNNIFTRGGKSRKSRHSKSKTRKSRKHH
jgi:hypothetical protein